MQTLFASSEPVLTGDDEAQGAQIDGGADASVMDAADAASGARWVTGERALRSVHFALVLRAAQSGSPTSSHVTLGDMYFHGSKGVVDVNMAKAAQHYAVAAAAHVGQANFNLGYMYERGLGVPQDFNLAKRFYDKAAEIEPHSQWLVDIAMLSLNVRWWWQHFVVNSGRVIDPSAVVKTAAAASTEASQTRDDGYVVRMKPGADGSLEMEVISNAEAAAQEATEAQANAAAGANGISEHPWLLWLDANAEARGEGGIWSLGIRCARAIFAGLIYLVDVVNIPVYGILLDDWMILLCIGGLLWAFLLRHHAR